MPDQVSVRCLLLAVLTLVIRWAAFCAKSYEIENRLERKSTATNERYLFHGTQGASRICLSLSHHHFVFAAKHIDTIAKIGFNRDFTEVHVYGVGVYFARDAEYSQDRRYSPADASGLQRIIVAKVCVGDVIENKDQNKKPATLPRKSNGLPYETMVNNATDPSIFVATLDDQAYPEFVVTFRVG